MSDIITRVKNAGGIFSANNILDPKKQRDYLHSRLSQVALVNKVLVKGPINNRVIFAFLDEAKIAISLNKIPFCECIPDELPGVKLHSKEDFVSVVEIKNSTIRLFEYPKIHFVVLCHPENFPMPRFALGVAYLASALRNSFLGDVSLYDMQLGIGIDDLIAKFNDEEPDIIGISVTFGQQDIVDSLLKRIEDELEQKPKLLLGGSVVALNKDILLNKYPELNICLNNGEETVVDFARYWHGFIKKSEVRNLAYRKENKNVDNGNNIIQGSYIPELDSLEDILEYNGVFLLETSRGCFNHCTFCPRQNKGKWYGMDVSKIQEIMPYLSMAFRNYPDHRKKIFLVDEEFIGRSGDSHELKRIDCLAKQFYDSGFKFEASARIDQVYNIDKDREWHIERMEFWKRIRIYGLEKCLFGVEAGIDSILRRFGKNVLSIQNILAIRMLTSLGPSSLRVTYITFDPLMTMDELIASYYFQRRDDLILKETEIDHDRLYDLMKDEAYVNQNKKGWPLYRIIPYMLVSLECLLGSTYLKELESYGLHEDYNLNMGKRNTRYLNPDIGLMSRFSQLWIDRNFALDYALKSFAKIWPDVLKRTLMELRYIIKDYAYILLGKMLCITNRDLKFLDDVEGSNNGFISEIIDKYHNANNLREKEDIFIDLLDSHFLELRTTFATEYKNVEHLIANNRLGTIVDNWKNSRDWKLINE